jgi:hypothetical protein
MSDPCRVALTALIAQLSQLPNDFSQLMLLSFIQSKPFFGKTSNTHSSMPKLLELRVSNS